MFPLFFPYRWTRNDWQETCGAKYSADRDDDFISLFAHYQLFTCTVIFSLWTHFLTFCRQQCGGNQKSPFYQSVVHDNGCHASCLGYFLASVKMLHCVTRRLACNPSYGLLSPTAPNKEAVKCLTSYSLFKNAMTSSESLFKQEIQIFGISDIVIIVVCQDLVWEDPISPKSTHTWGE